MTILVGVKPNENLVERINLFPVHDLLCRIVCEDLVCLLILLKLALCHSSQPLVIGHLSSFVQVLGCLLARFGSEVLGGATHFRLEVLLASFRVVEIVSQVVRMGKHHLRPFSARVEITLTKTIIDCRSINLGILLSTGKASFGKLCLLSVRLESALSVQASTVYIHLSLITADSILVETIELGGAFPTVFTSPTYLIQEL